MPYLFQPSRTYFVIYPTTQAYFRDATPCSDSCSCYSGLVSTLLRHIGASVDIKIGRAVSKKAISHFSAASVLESQRTYPRAYYLQASFQPYSKATRHKQMMLPELLLSLTAFRHTRWLQTHVAARSCSLML